MFGMGKAGVILILITLLFLTPNIYAVSTENHDITFDMVSSISHQKLYIEIHNKQDVKDVLKDISTIVDRTNFNVSEIKNVKLSVFKTDLVRDITIKDYANITHSRTYNELEDYNETHLRDIYEYSNNLTTLITYIPKEGLHYWSFDSDTVYWRTWEVVGSHIEEEIYDAYVEEEHITKTNDKNKNKLKYTWKDKDISKLGEKNDTVKLLFEFDAPIIKQPNGWGSKGLVSLGIGEDIYFDTENSSDFAVVRDFRHCNINSTQINEGWPWAFNDNRTINGSIYIVSAGYSGEEVCLYHDIAANGIWTNIAFANTTEVPWLNHSSPLLAGGNDVDLVYSTDIFMGVWSFTDNGTGDMLDLTANDNHGQAVGAQIVDDGGSMGTVGDWDTDGNGDHFQLNLDTASTLDLDDDRDVTFMTWYRTDASDSNEYMFGPGAAVGGTAVLATYISSSDQSRISNVCCNEVASNDAIYVVDTEYNFLVSQYDQVNDVVYFYQNNNLDSGSPEAFNLNFDAFTTYTIGIGNGANANTYFGELDEMKLIIGNVTESIKVQVYRNEGGAGGFSTVGDLEVGESVAPLVTILSPSNTSEPSIITNFNISVIEQNSDTCLYSLDGSANRTLTNRSTASASNWNDINTTMTEQTHIVDFYCNDTFGNVNDTESIVFTIELAPEITIVSPTNTTTTSSIDITLALEVVNTSGDVETWKYSLDGAANVTFTPNTTITATTGLPRQNHNLVVFAVDTQGRETNQSVFFTVGPPGLITADWRFVFNNFTVTTGTLFGWETFILEPNNFIFDGSNFSIESTARVNTILNTFSSTRINFTGTQSAANQKMNVTVTDGRFTVTDGTSYIITKDGTAQQTVSAVGSSVTFEDIDVGSEYIILEQVDMVVFIFDEQTEAAITESIEVRIRDTNTYNIIARGFTANTTGNVSFANLTFNIPGPIVIEASTVGSKYPFVRRIVHNFTQTEVDAADFVNITLFLPPNTVDVVLNNFVLNDLTNEFPCNETSFIVRKFINSTDTIMNQQEFSVDCSSPVFLMADNRYQLVVDNGVEERILGNFFPFINLATVPLTIRIVSFPPGESKFDIFRWNATRVTNTIVTSWLQTDGGLTSINISVFNATNISSQTFLDSTVSLAQQGTFIFIPTSNDTFRIQVFRQSSTLGVLNESVYIDFFFTTSGRRVDPSSNISANVLRGISYISTVVVALVSGAAASPIGYFLLPATVAVFQWLGWYQLNNATVGIILLFSLFALVGARRPDKEAYRTS